MRYLRLLLVQCLVSCLLTFSTARAEERILAFDSAITVHADSTMTVTETIRVRCENKAINHGIFRDFPTRYKGPMGTRYRVGFKVKEVLRAGKPEAYHTKPIDNGIRVYMGQKNAILKTGEHTFSLTYETNRQLGFFDDHDELYWNVTGSDWQFPIDAVTAEIRLPAKVPEADMKLEAYTGPQGTTGRDYTASVEAPGLAQFAATRPLASKEGLTIVVAFPKGLVTEPTSSERLALAIKDDASTIAALAALVGILTYYTIVWVMVGKDPPAGRILPKDAPPPGFSPAALRFIKQMGFDKSAFTAAIMDMAIKGYLRIEEEDGKFFLVRDHAGPSVLSPEEAKVAGALLGQSGELKIERKNHMKFSKAQQDCAKALKRDYEKKYFLTNRKFILPGVLFSLAALLIGALTAQAGGNAPPALFMCVWLTGWSVGVLVLGSAVISLWAGVLKGELKNLPGAFGMTLFATPFFGGEAVGAFMLYKATSLSFVVLLFALVVINIVFYQLLKAPTLLGRQLLDEVEGFCMTLRGEGRVWTSVSEAEQQSIYERYLAYAVALGEEKGWSETFANALGRAGEEPSYHPVWYHGPRWHTLGPAGFAHGLTSSLGTAVEASSTAPGSSSGSGGGGSSGGGGGGGGGGGW